MALKLTAKHPSLGDVEFEVPGVALLKNGGSVTLTEEDEANFFARTGMKVRDYYKDDGTIEVSGSSDAKLPASAAAPTTGGDNDAKEGNS
jgi:hypothetical protein